jgi:hypothetical protein
MDSAEFLELVKELSADTLRIVLSGHPNLPSLLNAINHGAIYRVRLHGKDNQVGAAITIGTAHDLK